MRDSGTLSSYNHHITIMSNLVLGCYKLVLEPWFEGFGHTFECVRTQTKEMIIFSKEKELEILKNILLRKREYNVCNQLSSSNFFPSYPYICSVIRMHDM